MRPDRGVESPVQWVRKLIRNAWRDMRSIYYANSWSWRALKSGALFFGGFFLWSSSNLLLSYRPGWTFLYYPMAYGFILIPYGPFTHLVMVPLTIRLRKQGKSINRYMTKGNLAVFFAIVLLLGTFPPSVMVFDFQSQIGDGSQDIDPHLGCTIGGHQNQSVIHCHISESEGIDSVQVRTIGGRELLVDSEPPFEFNINESNLEEDFGQPGFQVVLRDGNGDTIRIYSRYPSQMRSS